MAQQIRDYITLEERILYSQAIHTALYVLVEHAEKEGRGWFHFYEDGKILVDVYPKGMSS